MKLWTLGEYGLWEGLQMGREARPPLCIILLKTSICYVEQVTQSQWTIFLTMRKYEKIIISSFLRCNSIIINEKKGQISYLFKKRNYTKVFET